MKKTRQEYMTSVIMPFKKVDVLLASLRCFNRIEQLQIIEVWNEAAMEVQKNLETLLTDVGIVSIDDSTREKSSDRI